jgi:CHAT domain-containing protein/tetratricopeptide (TPR) repeat protein
MVPWFRTRDLFLKLCPAPVLLLFTLAAPVHQASAQDSVKPAYTVTSGHSLTVELRPREFTSIDFLLAGGKYNEIRIESPVVLSRGAFVKAVPDPPLTGDAGAQKPDSYISDSGEPFVRIPILPAADQAARFQVTALTNSKTDTRPVTATLTLIVEDATPHTALVTKAIHAFVHGERIRRDRGKAESALPAYDEALGAARELGDKVMEQRVLLSKARFLDLDGSHYSDAVQYAKQATEIETAAESPTVSALAWKTLGGAYLDMDRYTESIEASKRAADLFRQAGITYWLGIVLENLGDAYLANGNLDAALKTDTEALGIARELKDDYGVIEMLSEIGSIHRDRAEYQAALNNFSAAVELSLPSSFNPMQAEAWSHLGELYTVLGENDQALSAYQHSLTIAQSTRNGLAELGTLDRIGELQLEAGQREQAQQTFTRALARAEELKLTRQQSGLLAGLARTEIKQGNLDEASAHLKQALDLAAQIHQSYEQADALSAQAALAQTQGRTSDAETALQQSNDLWRSLPDQSRLAQGLSQLAELEVKSGNLQQANDYLAQAVDLIENSRGSIARGGLRTQYFALQHHTYDLAVYTEMQLNLANPDGGYAAKAWEIAERARARSLLDSLGAENAESGDPAQQPLREHLAVLGRQIEDSQDRIAQLGTSAADIEKAGKLQQSLHQSLTEEQELESRLSSIGAKETTTPAVLTPAAFAHQALGPRTSLLEYWEGERASYVWLVSHDGTLHVATLPSASQLNAQVASYEKDLLARNSVLPNEDFAQRSHRFTAADARLDQHGRRLGETLLPPAIHKALNDADTLLIIPDGSLHSIPFTALIEPGSKQYLIQRYRLINEPSAAAAAAVAPLAARNGDSEQRVAIFADPVYSKTDGRFQKPDAVVPAISENVTRGAANTEIASLDLSNLPRLPGSRQEALAISAAAGPQNSSLHMGFEATPGAVKTLDWKTYSVAHFAAHAVASPNVPESSGIVLSMVDTGGHSVDGMLWLRDIRRLHLASDLVVLSGCGTALGENIPGEGLNSLSRAFLASGTRDVTATLWSADDGASSQLMRSFYHGFVKDHLPAPTALRAAQLQMLQDARYRAPYYWAGFVMEGAWQAR